MFAICNKYIQYVELAYIHTAPRSCSLPLSKDLSTSIFCYDLDILKITFNAHMKYSLRLKDCNGFSCCYIRKLFLMTSVGHSGFFFLLLLLDYHILLTPKGDITGSRNSNIFF